MTTTKLHKHCIDTAEKYPELAKDINVFYEIALRQIEEGGDIQYVCEIAIYGIDLLTYWNKNKPR